MIHGLDYRVFAIQPKPYTSTQILNLLKYYRISEYFLSSENKIFLHNDIKLENIMFEITKEESDELKNQVLKLENKNKEMEEKMIKQKELDNEKFYVSPNFIEWYEADADINTFESYKQYCNSFTPNMIWGLTIVKK